MSQGDYPDRKLPVMPLQELRISTRSRRPRDQGTSQRHLRCGRYDRSLHLTMSNPGNGSEFDQNDEESYRHCRVESRDQERQRMAAPTERCHDTETNPRAQGWPRPVRAPSSESASAKPMLIAAMSYAANPTRSASQEFRVARAAANTGASVDNEPSMSPARLVVRSAKQKVVAEPYLHLL